MPLYRSKCNSPLDANPTKYRGSGLSPLNADPTKYRSREHSPLNIGALTYYYLWEMVKDGNDFYLCGYWNDGTNYKAYVEKRSFPFLSRQVDIGFTDYIVSNTLTEYFEDVIVDANYVYTIGRAYNSATTKVNGIVQRRSKTNLNIVDWTYWLVNGINNTSFHSITQDNNNLYVFGCKGTPPFQDTIIKLTKAGAFDSSYDPANFNGAWGGITLHTDGYLYLSGEFSGNLIMGKVTTNFTGFIGGYTGASFLYKNTILDTNIIGAGGTVVAYGGNLVTQSRKLSNITVTDWTRTQDYVVGQQEYFLDITNDGTYLYMTGVYYNIGVAHYVALYQCITSDGASVIWTKEADTNKLGRFGGCIISGSDFWVCVYENISPWRCWIEKRGKSDGNVQQSWLLEG